MSKQKKCDKDIIIASFRAPVNRIKDKLNLNNDNEKNKSKKKINEMIIASNNKTIKKKEEFTNINLCNTINKFSIINVNINLINNIDNKKIKIKKTNLSCWWCTYGFKNLPWFCPDKYYKKTYYVFGCFCSPNCVLAYSNNLHDNKIFERCSLIKIMVEEACGKKKCDIKPAAPKEVLEKYCENGITIDKYRKNFIKNYVLLIPPMTTIILNVEEKMKIN